MIVTWLYIAIVAWLLGMVIWNLYREESPGFQITAVMVCIPLLLRLLGVK